MHEWPGQDPTAVRATDLASAAVVVVRFRRRRKATVAAALSVGVAMFVSSQGMFRISTTSLVPTDPPPTTAPNGVVVGPTPAAEPSPPGRPVSAGVPAREAPGQVPDPATAAPSAPGEPRAEARRRGTSRIPVVRVTKHGNDSLNPCGLNPVPSNPSLCLTSRASQQKSGSVVLTYTACQAQPSLAAATVTFPTAREVDFAIQKDGRTVWQWSTGQRFAVREHRVLIGTNQCVQWRTRWTGLLDDGTRVAPGQYRLRAAGRDAGGMLRLRRHTFVVKF